MAGWHTSIGQPGVVCSTSALLYFRAPCEFMYLGRIVVREQTNFQFDVNYAQYQIHEWRQQMAVV
jgi:hypothetical protein